VKLKFQLGQRVATPQGFIGRVEGLFISADEAYGAQIAHRRVRLAVKLEQPAGFPHRRPPTPSFHYFLVAPGGRSGAMIAEGDGKPLSSRAAHTSPRYALGTRVVDPYGFVATITAIYRRLESAIQAGVISPGWFELQERRPASKRQPFYGCTGEKGVGGVLVGEAEIGRTRS
jgi:hypothetical protein